MKNLEQHRTEQMRWLILRIAEAGRPIGVSETMIQLALSDTHLKVSRDELRRELAYLRDLGLISIEENDDDSGWFASLTPRGVQVVEYTTSAPAGIGRPERN